MKPGRSIAEDVERLGFLTKAPLERLTPHAQACYYPKGSRICEGPQLSEAAYLILSGYCELRTNSPEGTEEVVENLGPGKVFGGLDEAPEGTSAVAVAESVLLRIERSRLELLRAEAAGTTEGDEKAGEIAVEVPSEPGQKAGRHQVVLLSFLSEQIPASQISEHLAGALYRETNAPIVLVRLEMRDEKALQRAVFLNGEFHMPAQVARTEGGFHLITLGIGDDGPSPAGIASLADKLSGYFQFVLIQAPALKRVKSWLVDFLVRSDLAYTFLDATEADIGQLGGMLRGIQERSGKSIEHVKPIGCLEGGRMADGFDLRVEQAAIPMHMYVHDCPMRRSMRGDWVDASTTRLFNADIRRLAREIGGQLVGLALSSGAAKGFSHIGVIQVLEESGIEVDAVAGCSMGAYVGSLWNYGLDGGELERLAREMEEPRALWSLVDPVFLPRQGFLRGLAVKRRLMRSIGTARFGDLRRPLRVVAGNLATLERVVFASGEVATAVHCSAAVPGICVPITIGGETYVDGAVVDPLPVDVLREMGVSKVIAVDAIPTPDRIRYTIQIERERVRQKEGRVRARKLFRRAPLAEPQPSGVAGGNLLQIVMRSLHGAQIRVAEASCRLADLVLRPNIYNDCWLDCAKPGKFITLGREVAERHLDEIKALVSGRTANLEREPVATTVATIA